MQLTESKRRCKMIVMAASNCPVYDHIKSAYDRQDWAGARVKFEKSGMLTWVVDPTTGKGLKLFTSEGLARKYVDDKTKLARRHAKI